MSRGGHEAKVRQMRFAKLYAQRHRRELMIGKVAETLSITEQMFQRRSPFSAMPPTQST